MTKRRFMAVDEEFFKMVKDLKTEWDLNSDRRVTKEISKIMKGKKRILL